MNIKEIIALTSASQAALSLLAQLPEIDIIAEIESLLVRQIHLAGAMLLKGDINEKKLNTFIREMDRVTQKSISFLEKKTSEKIKILSDETKIKEFDNG